MVFPPLVFCDTSFFYACLDPRDRNHARAHALAAEAASVGTTFSTTWDIISETGTLLRYRHNYQAALAFLADVKPRFTWSPTASDCGRKRNRFFERTLTIIVSPSATLFPSWS